MLEEDSWSSTAGEPHTTILGTQALSPNPKHQVARGHLGYNDAQWHFFTQWGRSGPGEEAGVPFPNVGSRWVNSEIVREGNPSRVMCVGSVALLCPCYVN